jgi:hypothetical protein
VRWSPPACRPEVFRSPRPILLLAPGIFIAIFLLVEPSNGVADSLPSSKKPCESPLPSCRMPKNAQNLHQPTFSHLHPGPDAESLSRTPLRFRFRQDVLSRLVRGGSPSKRPPVPAELVLSQPALSKTRLWVLWRASQGGLCENGEELPSGVACRAALNFGYIVTKVRRVQCEKEACAIDSRTQK